jgi:hypothetical protein
MDQVGGDGEFTIQEPDRKTIAHTAISLIDRTMRENNYVEALRFLNAIPNELQLGESAKDDAIRMMFFAIISHDFDNIPEAAAMHMLLLPK